MDVYNRDGHRARPRAGGAKLAKFMHENEMTALWRLSVTPGIKTAEKAYDLVDCGEAGILLEDVKTGQRYSASDKGDFCCDGIIRMAGAFVQWKSAAADWRNPEFNRMVARFVSPIPKIV